MASLLSVENLQVQFQTKKGINTAVDGVSFSIEKGRILGIVGESGCGKSVTSMSILQLLGSNARICNDLPGSYDSPESYPDHWKPADGADHASPELQ